MLLISDSICKHVTGVNGLALQCFPGATIWKLTAQVKNNLVLQQAIAKTDFVILHVGTNDIHRLSAEEFTSALNDLLCVVRTIKNSVNISYSAMLPRPVDFSVTRDLVIKANNMDSSLV